MPISHRNNDRHISHIIARHHPRLPALRIYKQAHDIHEIVLCREVQTSATKRIFSVRVCGALNDQRVNERCETALRGKEKRRVACENVCFNLDA